MTSTGHENRFDESLTGTCTSEAKSHPTFFDARLTARSAREREKPSQWQCSQHDLIHFSLRSTYIKHTHSLFLSILSMRPRSTSALPDQQDQSGQIRSATCSCVQDHPSNPAPR